MTNSAAQPGYGDRRVLILNPESGSADHGQRVRSLARERGFDVRITESAEDIVETAADAAPTVDVLAAAGGDGTITRAARGIDRADALDDTLFGVVPAGTGNNFAENIGVVNIDEAFEIIASGERRRIDIGIVNDEPFLNSVVTGLTAESSANTDPAAKERWGVLAYVIQTLQTAAEFAGLEMTIRQEDETIRDVTASIVLVGNGRRFPLGGESQADMEDGLLDVTVIKDASVLEHVGESLLSRLGERTNENVERFKTPELEVRIEGKPDSISIDGEILTAPTLALHVREKTLWLPVGDEYEPEPDV
ncbi:diacylglycerol kinase [Halobacteriales archaeon QS_4_62_28]|nr:MAG: diacylglycerol kinase [Halobacteriales archaeon QS_4_62_28]